MSKTSMNAFDRIRIPDQGYNTFDLSYDNKLTLGMGKLVPVMCKETVPGDLMSITPEMFLRFQPLISPVMHRIDATIHFFYCPNRILWQNWEKYLAGESYAKPYIQGTVPLPLVVGAASLWDYLGLPLTANLTSPVNALPLMAYLRIWNEYYMDQNNDPEFETVRDGLQALSLENGALAPTDFPGAPASWADLAEVPYRAWEHDYFTSALPFAQKGDAVNIPLTLGPLDVEVATMEEIVGGAAPNFPFPLTSGAAGLIGVDGQAVQILGNTTTPVGALQGTINQFRIAMQTQKFLELNARAGTRYPELMKAQYGEDIKDYRISRPEYLGGIRNNVVISEVLQAYGAAAENTVLGDFAGHGVSYVSGNSINYRCPEHGFIIGILSVRPKTAYMQGIAKQFLRLDYLSEYNKLFAHIGEQAIQNQEVYYPAAGADGQETGTFGYIPQYSEFKYNPSEAHGEMRGSLDFWHLARMFSNRPVLNEEFIYMNNTDMERIFAVTGLEDDQLIAHIYFNWKAKRKIPFFTDPGGL